MIKNEYFIAVNIFVLKGDLNGKIVVVRFFFCRVYKTKFGTFIKSTNWGKNVEWEGNIIFRQVRLIWVCLSYLSGASGTRDLKATQNEKKL